MMSSISLVILIILFTSSNALAAGERVLVEDSETFCPVKECFNLASVASESALVEGSQNEGGDAKFDAIASLITNMNLERVPVTMQSYFHSSADYDLNFTNVRRSCVDNFSLNQCLRSIASANWGAKFSSYAGALVLNSIIEYEDVDGDGKFNPSKDEVYQTYGGSSISQPFQWKKLVTTTWTNGENEKDAGYQEAKSYAMTTLDGKVTASYTIANKEMKGRLAGFLTPNATKMSLTIKNWSFIPRDTPNNVYLAAEWFVATASAGEQSSVSTAWEKNSDYGFTFGSYVGQYGSLKSEKSVTPHGYASFKETASTSLNANGADVDVSISGEEVLAPGGAAVFDILFEEYASAQVKRVYTTFQAATRAEFLYYDPEVGYGAPVPENSGISAGVVLLLIVGLVATVSLFYLYRQSQDNNGLPAAYDRI